MNDNPQREPELLQDGEPYYAPNRRRTPSVRTRWNRRLLVGILLIETCVVLPKYAHGQFLGVFDSIFSSIQNDIGPGRKRAHNSHTGRGGYQVL